MIVNFSKTAVKEVVENEDLFFAQLPIIRMGYFDIESDMSHIVSVEVDESKVVGSNFYYGRHYLYYREEDRELFKGLLE